MAEFNHAGGPILKYENPSRLAELVPEDTLKSLLGDARWNLCDMGAGTGIFAFAAANLTDGAVYAVDIHPGMLELMKARVGTTGGKRVSVLHVDEMDAIPAHSVDVTVMSTVLHGIQDLDAFMLPIQRIMKPDGMLLIVEFHPTRTPAGPPPERRIDADEVKRRLSPYFKHDAQIKVLGENFYLYIATLRV